MVQSEAHHRQYNLFKNARDKFKYHKQTVNYTCKKKNDRNKTTFLIFRHVWTVHLSSSTDLTVKIRQVFVT